MTEILKHTRLRVNCLMKCIYENFLDFYNSLGNFACKLVLRV